MIRKTALAAIFTISAAAAPLACTPASYISTESMAGTALGAAAGTGVGLLYAQKVGNSAQNIIVNGAIGAGVGLLAGAILHERNLKIAREREVVLREARMLDQNQKEIDDLRQRIDDASNWGANETEPWDHRYQQRQHDRPYQGPVGM